MRRASRAGSRGRTRPCAPMPTGLPSTTRLRRCAPPGSIYLSSERRGTDLVRALRRLLAEELQRDVARGVEVVDLRDVRALHEVDRPGLLRGLRARPVVVDDERAVDLEDRAVVREETELVVAFVV